MSTGAALQPSFTWIEIDQKRQTKRELIQEFFMSNLGKKFGTREMHYQWGTAFRTRVSEINNDSNAPIVIKNEMKWNKILKQEESCYFAEAK